MSWYISLSISTASCVPRYLSYGVDYTKGLFRLSSGVVALSQMEYCLVSCVRWCWFGFRGCVVLFLFVRVVGLLVALFVGRCGLALFLFWAGYFLDHCSQYTGIA